MTKTDIESLDYTTAQAYYEYDYPFVLPENEVIDVLPPGLVSGLSALEVAFVRWMLETSNREIAVEKFIHPAHYYDKDRFGANYLKNKGHVTDVLREIRKNCPYLKLYSSDYIAGLLHDEIQYLRAPSRKDRFYGPMANPVHTLGKKSPHDQEMEEIDRLLACVKQIHELKMASGGFTGGGPDSKQSDVDSGIDRIIARNKELIIGRENGSRGGT